MSPTYRCNKIMQPLIIIKSSLFLLKIGVKNIISELLFVFAKSIFAFATKQIMLFSILNCRVRIIGRAQLSDRCFF